MSKDNIESFFEAVKSSPELQRKVAESVAESLARVATEDGKPFTAEEFLAAPRPAEGELSEAQMAGVAGGGEGAAASSISEFFSALSTWSKKPDGIRI